jgi:hypothetical protein
MRADRMLFSPHSFRITVVTDLLNQNVPLEDVPYLAAHSNPRTTQIYDRRRRRVTRNCREDFNLMRLNFRLFLFRSGLFRNPNVGCAQLAALDCILGAPASR